MQLEYNVQTEAASAHCLPKKLHGPLLNVSIKVIEREQKFQPWEVGTFSMNFNIFHLNSFNI